jgi:hypothetical protein
MSRLRQLGSLLAVIFFLAVTLFTLRRQSFDVLPPISAPLSMKHPQSFERLPATIETTHPVRKLITEASEDFDALLKRQSKTLNEATNEYRQRYGLPPPPNFDKWYEFAKAKDIVLIDEYDGIMDTIRPFWGLAPHVIRQRLQESLGWSNNLLGVAVRDGKVKRIENGEEWQQQATTGILANFAEFLPDMDLAFNLHDEPRVIVPAEDLDKLVSRALNENMPKAMNNAAPQNHFSQRPKDVGNGQRFREFTYTRFNVFAHQPTWTHSKVSCPASSPARSIDEFQVDNQTSYATGSLGFIYNATALSDICLTPSLSTRFGFFDRPNAYNIIHDLYPIFSQSKISSYQDILYPSTWYWADKVPYTEEKDVEWDEKKTDLFWRGSTTGGYSRSGGWRRQHRQHFVSVLNAYDKAKILTETSAPASETKESKAGWTETTILRSSLKDKVDVHFSHVGQCDAQDCEQQKVYFHITPPVPFSDAFNHKFVADIDGNAYSGRFYALLKSKSAVLKQAIFREWHADWIKPWVHYIPLSFEGDEWLEIVRYLSEPSKSASSSKKAAVVDASGADLARRIAEQGSYWGRRTLSSGQLEVYMFRLLLEYARVMDDARDQIGYGGIGS